MDKKQLIYFIAAVLGFVVLLFYVGIEKIVGSFSSVNPLLLLCLGATVPGQYVFRAYRWRTFLAPVIKETPRKKALFAWQVFGDFINWVIPAGGMGALIKSGLFSRDRNERFSVILSTVMIERMMDGIAVALLGLSGLILLGQEFQTLASLVFISLLSVLLISLMAIVLVIIGLKKRTLYLTLVEKIARVFPAKICEKIVSFVEGSIDGGQSLTKGRNVASIVFYTGSLYGSILLGNAMLFLSFAVTPTLGVILAGTSVWCIIQLIPSPPVKAGSFELLWTAVFGALGVPLATALAMGILYHVILFFIYVPLGLASTSWVGLKLRDILTLVKKENVISVVTRST